MTDDATTPTAPTPERGPHPATPYRAPQLVTLGTAAGLMRTSVWGHLVDGNQGWWVWNS